MGLIVPRGPDWNYYISNMSGTPNVSNSSGTSFTTGASNSDGTAVTVFSALEQDIEFLRVGFDDFDGIPTEPMMFDVLVDPSGGSTWSSLIESLLGPAISYSTTAGAVSQWYEFPIWIPAGTSIGIRGRGNGSAFTGKVSMFGCGGNSNPASWWCGQKITAIGANRADSGGQAHTSGNSGAFSSWANLGSTLSQDCGALQWGVGAASGGVNAFAYRFEFGVAGQIIGAPVMAEMNSTLDAPVTWPKGVLFKRLPSGTQLQVRGTCSSTADAIDVAAYAVH